MAGENLGIAGIILYLICLLIQVLQKYLKSEPVRNEKKLMAKTLGGSHSQKTPGMSYDAGMCCGCSRCQPSGCIQMGKRSQ